MIAFPVSAQSAVSACPNEAIRAETHSTALPECRAYELVTPSFKEGWPVFGSAIAEGPDGVVSMVGESFGDFAEQGNLLLDADAYEFTRGAEAWTARGFEPPASLYPALGGGVLSANLTRKLVQLPLYQHIVPPEFKVNHEGGKEFQFYLLEPGREPVPGAEAVLVGPQVPETTTIGSETKVLGGSIDLSHVVYEIQGGGKNPSLWPGDETESKAGAGRNSLYEYVGTGNSEPVLVGVSNEGPLHGSPSPERRRGSHQRVRHRTRQRG